MIQFQILRGYLFKPIICLASLLFFALPSFSSEVLRVVDNQNVCMVTDMHFGKKQIPVSHDGKTYYGCCENCKKTLTDDPKARTAIDPISRKPVDKAKAFIAAGPDNSVVYFESNATLKSIRRPTSQIKATKCL